MKISKDIYSPKRDAGRIEEQETELKRLQAVVTELRRLVEAAEAGKGSKETESGE